MTGADMLWTVYATGVVVVLGLGIAFVRAPAYREPVLTVVFAAVLWPLVVCVAAIEMIADMTWRRD